MKQNQRGVLLLVKSAITGEALALPADFDLTAAFALAKKHGITSLLYYGALFCGTDAADPAMQAQFPRVLTEIAVCEKQMAEICRLTDAFDARGIDYMPLKGIGLRPLYPKPEMRRMGDADILIRTEQYDAIRAVMTELGYAEKEETDHELCWEKSPVYIELHKRLMGEDNKDFKSYFGDGWEYAEPTEGACRYRMNPEAEAVYLIAHFAKHYRNGGVGLRPLVDLWLFFQHHPALDEDLLRTELEKLKLYTFYTNVMRLQQAWFGDGETDEITDFITDVIFESEEYGAMRMRTVSGALRDKKNGGSVAGFTLRRIFRSVFVPFSDMCATYPVLCRLPFLLPLFWIFHFFRRAAKRGKMKNFVQNYLPTGSEEVSEYQKSLHYVGLDYFFE